MIIKTVAERQPLNLKNPTMTAWSGSFFTQVLVQEQIGGGGYSEVSIYMKIADLRK